MPPSPPPRPPTLVLLAFPSREGGVDPLFEALRGRWTAGPALACVSIDPRAPEEEGLDRLAAAVPAEPRALVLGGFSLGARLAVRLAPAVAPRALLCFGYPFHRRGAPLDRPGLDALRELRTPALIVQGSRDAHGDRPQVRGYGPLPPGVEVHWLDDGNHRLQPRARSGRSADSLLDSAARACAEFLGRTLLSPPR